MANFTPSGPADAGTYRPVALFRRLPVLTLCNDLLRSA